MASTTEILAQWPGGYENTLYQPALDKVLPRPQDKTSRSSPFSPLRRKREGNHSYRGLAGLALPRHALASHFSCTSEPQRRLVAPRVDDDRLAPPPQNIATNVILDRLDDLRLAPGKNDLRHQPGVMLGLLELNLEFTAR